MQNETKDIKEDYNDFSFKDIKQKWHRRSQVLTYLDLGHKIKNQMGEWVLSEDNWLCYVGKHINENKEESEVYLRYYNQLSEILKIIDSISEEEYARICASITLTQLRMEKYK